MNRKQKRDYDPLLFLQQSRYEPFCKKNIILQNKLQVIWRIKRYFLRKKWGDRRELNPQPPVPQTGALTN